MFGLTGNIPQSVKEALDRYVMHRIMPGGFLKAVLENDLLEAISRADVNNGPRLTDIVSYVYNELPSPCWGNKAAVKEWARIEQDCPMCLSDDVTHRLEEQVIEYQGMNGACEFVGQIPMHKCNQCNADWMSEVGEIARQFLIRTHQREEWNKRKEG